MSDLLKEAIADAKAVRETALAQAKIALEEAFTPRIQSMLSKQIQSEMEGDEEEAPEKEVDVAVEDDEETLAAQDEVPGEDVPAEEVPLAAQDEVPGDDEETYEEEDEEEPVAEEDEEDLDLEAILKELEDEVDEEEHEDEVEEEEHEDEVNEEGDEELEVDESLFEEDEEEEVAEGDEEELDLESILKALEEDDDSEELDEDDASDEEEVTELRTSLAEHKKVISQLRVQLNEINLLNAKLLFTNKLFKSYDLNNESKYRVVEMFDRTKNLREIKLVYATLQESFKTGTVKRVKRVTEGFASKAVSSTRSKKKIIAEGTEFANRLRKLAGIKKIIN